MVNPGTPAGQGKIIDKDDYLHLIMHYCPLKMDGVKN